MKSLALLFPLYNDWKSVSEIINKLSKLIEPNLLSNTHFYIVNDCSPEPTSSLSNLSCHDKIHIIGLMRNVGHQRAIAIGLSYLQRSCCYDYVLVMDADGEDRPEDVPAMLARAEQNPYSLTFAQRTKREESSIFKILYFVYKLIFKVLTGRVINFGNFSVIPWSLLKKITHVSEIWNNYPGGAIRSNIPIARLPLSRGSRIEGRSKMSVVALIVHGLSAISVFSDIVSVRLLLIGLSAILLAFTAGAYIFFAAAFSASAPSFVSIVLVSTILIVLCQAFFTYIFLIFHFLSIRSGKQVIPYEEAPLFIDSVITL